MKSFKKLIKTSVFVLLTGVFFSLSGNAAIAQTNRLITNNSAGKVRIGMTVSQARRAMRGFRFVRATDGEGIALIEIKRGNRVHMTVYAGEFDVDKPIDGNGKIEFIEVWDSRYKTANGVYPRMQVRSVERRFGKLVSIMLSEIEAREFGRFTNQPKGIDFRLQNRSGMAGIYPKGQSTTTRYSPTAYVFSLIVIGGDTPENPVTTLFSSQYTDLRTQCQTPAGQGSEGGHISTYCKGYDGYRIHMFDTATTMEINVESSNANKSVHLASQSLSFNRNNRKVEWRFRDGKPFAVIMRVFKYQRGNDGLIKYPVKHTAEVLVVKGLPGYERINYAVNVNSTTNPNVKARQMADTGYAQKDSGNASGTTSQNINISRFNRMIDIGIRNKQAWIKSPMEVVVKLVGKMQEVKSRTMQFVSPSAEGSDLMTVTVMDEGLLDDSVSSEKLVLKLKRGSGGVWKVLSGQRSWKCWQGRGHQNYSAVPCS